MPIENERKYVLRLDAPESDFWTQAPVTENIEQIYLMFNKKQSLRIRESMLTENGWLQWKYKMTFKQDVNKKTVEVETTLDRRDYELLGKNAILKFKKVRYHIEGWEVDFFKKNGKTYFVQAEFEMPEGKKKPDKIPDLIQQNLIHVVKRGDGRFSSKKLGDHKYAQRLMNTLLLEKA
jgi:CYTH domain-containing protein